MSIFQKKIMQEANELLAEQRLEIILKNFKLPLFMTENKTSSERLAQLQDEKYLENNNMNIIELQTNVIDSKEYSDKLYEPFKQPRTGLIKIYKDKSVETVERTKYWVGEWHYYLSKTNLNTFLKSEDWKQLEEKSKYIIDLWIPETKILLQYSEPMFKEVKK